MTKDWEDQERAAFDAWSNHGGRRVDGYRDPRPRPADEP